MVTVCSGSADKKRLTFMGLLNYKTGQRGVPILKHAKIDDDVEALLSKYDPTLLTDPRPLDVEDFVERFLGFNLHYENLSNNGCIWGMMVFNNRRILVYDPDNNGIAYHPVDANTILIDNTLLAEDKEAIFRSTVAHEAGHGLYHPQIFREDDYQLSLFPMNNEEKVAVTCCRQIDITGVGNGRRELKTDHDWIEHHAKYFSAALLMNKKAMSIVCGDERMRNQLIQFGLYGEELLAREVASTFNVSPASARIRISELGLSLFREDAQQTIFTIGYQAPIFATR